jgi:hypothetical protein
VTAGATYGVLDISGVSILDLEQISQTPALGSNVKEL